MTASAHVDGPTEEQLGALLDLYSRSHGALEYFRRNVTDFFLTSDVLNGAVSGLPIVHSVKSRLKNPEHLRRKVERKWVDGVIDADNFFERITDLIGVRVLHVHSSQFRHIHAAITAHVSGGYWALHEPPVAYSWDPESVAFFEGLGIRAERKESQYTSVHYVVRSHPTSPYACEIQVRTLFEEIWGEIDHALNYPDECKFAPCVEQLRVLAKLTATGTRLADSIFTTNETMNESSRG
jgi:ppGpp synthetase/RelA/SpoT-type nucleotidyltranferase